MDVDIELLSKKEDLENEIFSLLEEMRELENKHDTNMIDDRLYEHKKLFFMKRLSRVQRELDDLEII